MCLFNFRGIECRIFYNFFIKTLSHAPKSRKIAILFPIETLKNDIEFGEIGKEGDFGMCFLEIKDFSFIMFFQTIAILARL